ncbi:GtrA family protein [soil metagenome]
MKLPPFARFVLVGLVNTGIGFATILLLEYGLGADRRVANVGGYVLGGLVSYVLHREYSFESRRAHRQALPQFALAVTLCFLLNLAVLEFCVVILKLPSLFAQAAAVVTYTLAFYAISRHHVFKT